MYVADSRYPEYVLLDFLRNNRRRPSQDRRFVGNGVLSGLECSVPVRRARYVADESTTELLKWSPEFRI